MAKDPKNPKEPVDDVGEEPSGTSAPDADKKEESGETKEVDEHAIVVEESYGTEATRGMLWTSISAILARGLGFVSTIFLTHLIDKEDYGRANAAYSIAQTIDFFSRPGINAELVRRKERFAEAASLVVTICLGLFFLLGGTTFIFSQEISNLFNAPGANQYLRIALILPFLSCLFVVGDNKLIRDMRFGTQSLFEIGGSLSNVAVGLGLAALGWGGLAVIIGQMFREAIVHGGATAVTGLGWLKRPRWDGPLLKDMFSFGIPAYTSGLMEFAATTWDNLFVAKMFGPAKLGTYAVAYTIAYTPAHTIASRTANVVFATVARFSDDKQRRHDAILRSLGAVMLIMSPVSIIIMLSGPDLVQLVFPDKWTGMVSALVSGLSLVGVGLPLLTLPDYYLCASDMPRGAVYIMGGKVISLAIALAVFGRSSVVAAAWSVSGSFIFVGICSCFLMSKMDKISPLLVFRQLIPSTVGACLLGATIYGVKYQLQIDSLLVSLLLQLSLGGLAYVGYLFMFHRGRVMEIVGKLLGKTDDDDDDDDDDDE